MPTRDRERIIRAVDEMKTDPLAGDITALRGEYRGLYRRRVGSWRIIFALKTDGRACTASGVRPRYPGGRHAPPPRPPCVASDGGPGDVPAPEKRRGAIHLAIAAEESVASRRSRIYGGRDWVRLGAVELGLDCLRRSLQGLPVTERTDFERGIKGCPSP
jgi:hypothetical protein